MENHTKFSIINSTTPTATSADPTIDFLIYGILLNLLCLIGILGNGLGACILCRLKSPFNLLLVALSLSDLCVCLFHSLFVGVPVFLSYTRLLNSSWDSQSVWSGGIISGLFNIAYIASIYITLSISFERLCAIRWPLHAVQWFTIRRTQILIAFVTLFAISIKIPLLILFTSDEDTENSGLINATTLIDVTFEFAIPLPLIVIINVVIIYMVRKQVKIRQNGGGRRSEQVTKATKILLSIVAIYIPSIILGGLVFYFTIVHPELDNTPGSYYLLAAFRILLTFNSAINFVIYCFFGKDFRRALSNCWGGKSNQTSYPSTDKTITTTRT